MRTLVENIFKFRVSALRKSIFSGYIERCHNPSSPRNWKLVHPAWTSRTSQALSSLSLRRGSNYLQITRNFHANVFSTRASIYDFLETGPARAGIIYILWVDKGSLQIRSEWKQRNSVINPRDRYIARLLTQPKHQPYLYTGGSRRVYTVHIVYRF